MKFINSLSILLFIFILSACTDDLIYRDHNGEFEEGPLVEAYLSLSVNNYTISSAGTRAPEPSETPEIATDAEKRIDNIWVFQYDAATGQQLIKPVYYEITDQETLKNLKVLLKEDIESNICIVANTFNSDWINGDRFITYNQLKNKVLSNPDPIRFDEFQPIPMEGEKSGFTVHENEKVELQVSRMYAKLKISFGELMKGAMRPVSIEINNIPNYCRVSTLAKDDESAATYSADTDWITRSFYTDKDFNGNNEESPEYVIFVPENIQGETANGGEQSKDTDAPANALVLKILMMYKAPGSDTEESRYYTVYPGGNTYNNFNIKRNCVYRIKVNINSANEAHTPSSNCFVIEPGRGISFEPYYRIETGGIDGSDSDDVFKFENYLNPADESGDKVIDNVQILWQTKDAIGDNTNFDKVWFEKNADNPLHSKLYVKTNKEGNAVIGAYNAKKEIIWSWHIWITDNDPANVGKAIVYTTYRWDQNKIYSWQQGKNDNTIYERVPGYAIMPCNLGAISNDAVSKNFAEVSRTFGLLYQWGRKDPFPPLINREYNPHRYDEKATGAHYDYSNSNKIIKNNKFEEENPGTDEQKKIAFFAKIGNTLTNPIQYSINNPLVFICGTYKMDQDLNGGTSVTYCADPKSYFNNGDWITMNSIDKLWGGLTPNKDSSLMTCYTIDRSNNIHIYDNYGDKKTIFDPCPSGWRVPPGDLWLGFTKTGKNPGSFLDMNYDETKTKKTEWGTYIFMTKPRWDQNGNLVSDPGPSLFFPTQGVRVADGKGFRCGDCGNYLNATTDDNNRVNILHIHNKDYRYTRLFETSYEYTRKSIGAPVRCVRDRK